MVKNKIYFSDNDLESTDISTLFEYIEITDENAGEYAEVKKKIIKYFMGSSLTTFIQKSKVAENYNDLKKEMIKRYDIKKFFKPEDELSKLSDQKFDKFIKYITSFESLNAQINPPLTAERQIELFIRGVSDIEIKKAIDEGEPKELDQAIEIARTKANSKFKYDSLEFYNAGFTDKYIDKENRSNNNVQEQQVQQQVLRPTRIPFPPSGKHPEYKVKQEQNNYTNTKKPQFKSNPKGKIFKCYKCGKTGHFANKCTEQINTITEHVSFTTNQQDLKRVSLYGVLLINDQPTRCLIDTGSTITMIHESFAKHLNVKLENCDNDLRAANGSRINIKGKTILNIAIGKVKYTIHNVYVTSQFEFKCLLGINTLKVMKATINIANETLTSGDDDINLFTFGNIPAVKKESSNNNQVTDQDYHIPFHAYLQENVNAIAVAPRENRIKKEKVDNIKQKSVETNDDAVTSKDEAQPSQDEVLPVKEPVLLSKEELESYTKDKEVKEEIKEGLLKLKFPNEVSKSQAVPLIIKYQDVFTNTLTEPGAISGVEHQIKLTQKDASFQAYPVKFTNEQKDFLDKHIKELLKYKIIRESNSPVSSSVVLRPKPDGSMRMCINYTKLNNITVKDRYPIPDINEIWNQIKGSKVYSKLDMISGYYQIPIRESDKYLTAFSVPQGLFEFNVMPFGLCNAPAVFQRTIHKIFKEENRHTLQSFYDDILSHSKSIEEHTPHLEGIFMKMRENKLLAKLSKCQFYQEEVKFLGHIIESNGVQIDYDRLDPLMKLLEPKNVKELQRLIGTLNFFRKFVDNFASKIKPIYQLLRQDTTFEWNEAYKSICINIIEKLKNDKIILVYPDTKKPFKLETDASDIGVGATLSQDHGIISFYSRTIRDTEKNFSASEKECLSVVCALEEFHYIIGTQETLVVTDNSAVSFLRNDLGKIRNKRLINWNVKLASYNITFKYRSGKENTIADALSRCPVEKVMTVIPMDEPVKLDSNLDLKIAEEQRKDKLLAPLFKYLEESRNHNHSLVASRVSIEAPFHTVIKKVLFRLIVNPTLFFKRPQIVAICIVVPASMQKEVLEKFHDCSLVGGHLGYQKTFAKIASRYYWNNMGMDVKEYINNCDICQKMKTSPFSKFAPELGTIVVEKPWDLVAVDFVGPMKTPSIAGNKYIIVFSDYVTKWVEAVATPDCTAETTAIHYFNLIISRHGCPKRLLSDCGTSFLNKVISNVNEVFKVKKVNTSPYHPQTDGLVERFNKTIVIMLKSFTQEVHTMWDLYLDSCLFAYRISVHASTGSSPFSMIYGREATIPSDLGSLNPFNSVVTTNDNYVGKLKETIKNSLDIAKTKTQEAQVNQKQYYDGLRTRKNSISPGDHVLLKNQTVKEDELKKFRPSWIGPFKVVRILSNQTIQIQVPLGSNMSTTQSLRNCKKYFNRMNKLNQLPSFINQPSQVSMNELSFSRLASPSIVATSPPPPTNPPQNGQAVTQLPVVLPKSNRAGVNVIIANN
ncbi:hypothetical protein ACTFIZ_002137 [Dictyostelium cf. discoideum]